MLYVNPAALLVHVLMEEHRYDEAWVLVGRHKLRDVRQTLAAKTEKTHAREALDAYAERVDELASLGGDGPYREAVKIVKRMATLRSTDEQAAYVAALRVRHQRKRNFMKLLG